MATDKQAAVALRHQIAELLNRGQTISTIAETLGCSRTTVYKVKALLDDPTQSLLDRRTNNTGMKPQYSQDIRSRILELRAQYSSGPRMLYHQIMRDPAHFGFAPLDVPSPATIARIFNEAGVAKKPIGPRDKRYYPAKKLNVPGSLIIDSWGPYKIRGSRFYLVTCQDPATKLSIGIPAVPLVTVNSWMAALYGAQIHILGNHPWREVYSDNGIGMALSNGYTSRAVRFALNQGAKVVFIPPAQPWRNGSLERFHFTMESEYFRRAAPNSFTEATTGLVGWLNEYNQSRPHGTLQFRAPAEVAPWFTPLTTDIIRYHEEVPKLEPQPGRIECIRMVENDGGVRLFNNVVYISPVLAGAYVKVELDLDGELGGLGRVIWHTRNDHQPLVVGTFNHFVDNPNRGHNAHQWVENVREVDFEIPVDATANEKLDSQQAESQRARVLKRKRKNVDK
jgi:transposase-like protein